MARVKDPRGILTFIIRYLLLHVAFLIGLPYSLGVGLALFYFFGFMGFFTFIQVLASISQKFLDHGGAWKALVIMGAMASDVAVLWWLGWMLRGLFGGSDWEFVVSWLPLHFLAAFLAWGLREIIHAVNPGGTAEPRNPSGPIIPNRPIDLRASVDPDGPVDPRASVDPDGPVDPGSPADPGGSTSPSSSEDADAPTGGPASIDANTDDR